MSIQEIKQEIFAQKTEEAKYLFKQLKKNPGGETPDSENEILFAAFPGADRVLQFRLRKLKLKLWVRKDFKESLPLDTPAAWENSVQDNLESIRDALTTGQQYVIKNLKEEFNRWQQKNKKGKNTRSDQGEDNGEKKFIQELDKIWKEDIDQNFKFDQDFWTLPKHNPWCSFKMDDEGPYVLNDDDRKMINDYNKGKKDEQYIHLEVPPQPYIGNPAAEIWLLLMNPSYSITDFYDMVNCEKEKREATKSEILKSIKDRNGKPYYNPDEITDLLPLFFTNNGDNVEERINLMKVQLSFQKPEFYVLNSVFKTICTRDEIDQSGGIRKDSSCQGSYEWWGKYLLREDICSPQPPQDQSNEEKYNEKKLSRFFVLESFPYHSREFGKIDGTAKRVFP